MPRTARVRLDRRVDVAIDGAVRRVWAQLDNASDDAEPTPFVGGMHGGEGTRRYRMRYSAALAAVAPSSLWSAVTVTDAGRTYRALAVDEDADHRRRWHLVRVSDQPYTGHY